jgi:hypothetical protein
VPLGPKAGWGGVENPPELDIHLFPGADNRFELYEDDGGTTAYLQGRYALTPFTLALGEGGLTFTIGPVQGERGLVPARRTYRLHLRAVGPDVTCPHPARYDPAARSLDLEPVALAPGESFSVKFGW